MQLNENLILNTVYSLINIGGYYRLKVSVSKNSYFETLNPQCHGVRKQVLWEVIRSGEWIPQDEISALRRTELTFSLSTLCHGGHKKAAICKPGNKFSLDTRLASTFILGFLASRTVRNVFIVSITQSMVIC